MHFPVLPAVPLQDSPTSCSCFVIHAPGVSPGQSSGKGVLRVTLTFLIVVQLIAGLTAVIAGHRALAEIRDDSEMYDEPRMRGKGFAIAGLIGGYGTVTIWAIILLLLLYSIL